MSDDADIKKIQQRVKDLETLCTKQSLQIKALLRDIKHLTTQIQSVNDDVRNLHQRIH